MATALNVAGRCGCFRRFYRDFDTDLILSGLLIVAILRPGGFLGWT